MTDGKSSVRGIDHTADLGIEVEAANLSQLFSAAGEAFYALIADPTGIESREEISVSARGDGWEELWHAWLCELLAQFNLKGFVGKQCQVTTIDAGRMEAKVKGETLDLKRHQFYTEIKGVTYHGLRVWQDGGKWHARVIFDV